MKLKKYIILCLITSLTGGLSAQKTFQNIGREKSRFDYQPDRGG